MEKKFKILKLMYEMGWTDEGTLLSKRIFDFRDIQDITIEDIMIIEDIQDHILSGDLFSYLEGKYDNAD